MDARLAARSASLATAPALTWDPAARIDYVGEAVRRRAEEVMADVPFPPGRNSAAGLSWGTHEQMSTLAEADIQLMVQLNAMCDWLRYAVESAELGQLAPATRTILADLPRWPAVRRLPWHPDLAEAAASIESGDIGPLRALLRHCRRPDVHN
jgi:hypothetical protein